MTVSPFSNPAIWQLATFTFEVKSEPSAVDGWGNEVSNGRAIAVTFKIRPMGGDLKQLLNADNGNAKYEGRVTAVDSLPNTIFPSDIRLGDVGQGSIGDRPCTALIKDLSQSSVAPIVERVLGSKVALEIDYRIKRGSHA